MRFFYLLLLLPFAFQAQQFELMPQQGGKITVKNTTPDYQSLRKFYNGALYEDFSAITKVYTMVKDAPSLPVFSESVVVPSAGNFSLEITYDSFEEFDQVLVLPSKGTLKRNINPAEVPYTFGNEYVQNDFFPGNLAQVGQPFIFRNAIGVTIQFYPYQYNPVSKKLRVYKNITVSLINSESNNLNKENRYRIADNLTFLPVYRTLFLNAPAYTPVQDEGALLVITPDSYLDVIAPYVQWKKEKGMQTYVAPLSQTGTSPEDIKIFIASFYDANPNLTFVQLIGDHEDCPTYSYGLTGANEQLWSDSYYGQLTDDYFPELLVGRFSGNIAQVKTMIDRTLEYEINPLAGEWMLGSVGIGSNEGYGYGDDGEADWEHLRNIGYRLAEFGYTNFSEFFEGTQGGLDAAGNPTPSMINEALNSGAGIVNYTGHGAQNVMSTGNYTNSSLNQLTNNGKYPFVVSVACNNGTFVNGTALCEAFLRRSYNGTPAGAIGSCGSSILMAWAEPMQTQDEITELIVRSDNENIRTSLGGLFYNGQISMMEAYGESLTATEVMQTWVLFGDVSASFRSQQTADIVANHEMEMGAEGGILHIVANMADALVSLSQEDTILATGLTSEDGMANFDIPELASSSPIKVTLTKPNTRAYRGQVIITTLGLSDFENSFNLYPNPARDFVTIASNNLTGAQITLHDSHGRLILNNKSVSSQYTLSTSNLSAGIYFLSVVSEGKKMNRKIIIH
jgi:gingipain R